MTVYCFRVEADPVDQIGFRNEVDRAGICADWRKVRPAEPGGIGGLWEMDSTATLNDLLTCARRVVDGHIIVRTLREGHLLGQDLSAYVRLY